MYSEFHQFTTLGMSRPQFFVLKEDEEEEEDEKEKESKFKVPSKDTSQNSDGLEEIALKNPSSIQEDRLEEKEDFEADHDKEDKCGETSVSSTESEKQCFVLVGASTSTLTSMEVADDDEGFKTPTSSDHKIPVITQCPPAPKKTRPKPNPTTMKRKVSPTKTHRALHLDLSTEVESMFPPSIQDDDDHDDDIDSEIKKARTDDHDSSQ